MKNYRVHPTHWLISTQVSGKTRAPCVIYDCGELPPPVRDYS